MIGAGGQDGVAPQAPHLVGKEDEEEAAALLLRLASQFGDMDLSSLQQQQPPPPSNGAASESDESSSVVDPTPEELLVWQKEQFKIGTQTKDHRAKESWDTAGNTVGDDLRNRRQRQRQRRRNRTNGPLADDDHEAAHVAADKDDDSKEMPHTPPDLDGQESIFFPPPSNANNNNNNIKKGTDRPHNPLLSQLVDNDPEILGGKWKNLYSSNKDGLSFHGLLSAIQGYDGPSVMILGTLPSAAHSLEQRGSCRTSATRSSNRGTLGVYTASPWNESTKFHGTDDCFLFTIVDKERIQIFRPTTCPTPANASNATKKKQGGNNYMYCLSSSSNVTHPTHGATTVKRGMGVGGTMSHFRLHITETLEECRALPYEGTFEGGDLLPPSNNNGGGGGDDSLYYFDIEALEVWGVGGEDWIQHALSARTKHRDTSDSTLRKVRTVDKKQLLDHFRSGWTEDSKALFGHSEYTAGS